MLAPVEHIYNTLWCHFPEDGKLPWETVEICNKYNFFVWMVVVCGVSGRQHAIVRKDMQCTYNGPLCCVCVTNIMMEIQHCILCVFLSYMLLSTKENTNCCTKMLLWQIYVTRKNKMYLGLHVNCPVFLLFVTKFGVPWQIFLKVSNIKFHRNLSSWSCTDTYWLTDRWADRQGEANGLFCSSADVHNNRCIVSLENTWGKSNYFQAPQLLGKECYLHGHLFLYRNIWLNRDAHMWHCRGLFPSASLFLFHQLIVACELVLKITLLPCWCVKTVSVAMQLILDLNAMIFIMEGTC